VIFRPQDRDRSDLGASGESRPTHQIGAALVPPDHATQPLHAQLLLALHRTVVAGVDDAWHRRDGIAQNTNEKRTGGKKTIKGGRRKRWYYPYQAGLIIDHLYVLDDTPRRFSFPKLEAAVSSASSTPTKSPEKRNICDV